VRAARESTSFDVTGTCWTSFKSMRRKSLADEVLNATSCMTVMRAGLIYWH
jgi:hypothetical protein